mgnify:CR=1 FL=1
MNPSGFYVDPSFGQARPVRMHEAIHMYASPHAYVRVNRICIFFFPKSVPPFFTLCRKVFSNYPYRFDEFCSEFPGVMLEVLSDSPITCRGSVTKTGQSKSVPL